MEKEIVRQLHGDFEKKVKKDRKSGLEFWLARELQDLLGYVRWENFTKIIDKAKISCKNAGFEPLDHFLDVTKKVELGLGAKREIEDVALTRYACYLIAQNGDPSKDPIAFAQTYFAVQTRKQELIEERIAEVERLNARRKLSLSEKELSGIIFERIGDPKGFGRIRSQGDKALFGRTTEEMKRRLHVPKSRPLADFLPTITIKAKDFANEITNFTIKRDDLRSETNITTEHVNNNRGVRGVLLKRNIKPEELPAADDIKKFERKMASEEKKLPGHVQGFDRTEDNE